MMPVWMYLTAEDAARAAVIAWGRNRALVLSIVAEVAAAAGIRATDILDGRNQVAHDLRGLVVHVGLARGLSVFVLAQALHLTEALIRDLDVAEARARGLVLCAGSAVMAGGEDAAAPPLSHLDQISRDKALLRTHKAAPTGAGRFVAGRNGAGA